VWIKHGYGLPPGEERVLHALSERWAHRLPAVVASWPGAVITEAFEGRELSPSDPLDHWLSAAAAIAEIAAGERAHVGDWLALGVRDRRPPVWKATVESLMESPVVRAMEPVVLRQCQELVPGWISRFIDGFAGPATLVPQDSGCCNIHVSDRGPLLFDWADVVIGHPVFSCDRLLDQAPGPFHAPIIDAFLGPLDLSRDEFLAMRRSNVLHEVLRYHDELGFLPPDDPAHKWLADSVRSQLRVLVEHELAQD